MGLIDEDGEIEPGTYGFNDPLEIAAAKAELEQKRSEIIDALRISDKISVSVLDKNDMILHSAFVLGIKEEGEAESFLTYAALKSVSDLAEAIDKSMIQTLYVLARMIQDGVGENWL